MPPIEPSTPLRMGRIPLLDKVSWILSHIQGKSVLHAGATDYPMHREKAKAGELLHELMRGHCRELVGVDLSADAIAFLREQYRITDIVHGNVEQLAKVFPGRKFDVIVAG